MAPSLGNCDRKNTVELLLAAAIDCRSTTQRSRRVTRCCQTVSDARPQRFISTRPDSNDLLSSVLQHLPVRDKLRLETVSRRWRKCLYERHAKLVITADLEDQNNYDDIDLTVKVKPDSWTLAQDWPFNLNVVDNDKLRCVLKKCQAVSELMFEVVCDRNTLDVIGEFCQRLERLELKFEGLTIDDVDYFGQKYGHQLKYFISWSSACPQLINRLLSHCRNIEAINFRTIDCLTDLQLPALKSITDLDIFQDEDGHKLLRELLKFCRHSLIKFQAVAFNGSMLHEILSIISSLTNLETLTLNFYVDLLELSEDALNSIIGGVESIAERCCKLTNLQLRFEQSAPLEFVKSVGAVVAKINRLKKLNLCLFEQTDEEAKEREECLQLGTMPELTKLNLFHSLLTEPSLRTVDQLLPNLRRLYVDTQYCHWEESFDDECLFHLAKLTELRSFQLHYSSKCHITDARVITDSGVCPMITECVHLRQIRLLGERRITDKTIDVFIEKAKSKCKVDYILEFTNDIWEQNEEDDQQNEQQNQQQLNLLSTLEAINLEKYQDLPTNFKLEF